MKEKFRFLSSLISFFCIFNYRILPEINIYIDIWFCSKKQYFPIYGQMLYNISTQLIF